MRKRDARERIYGPYPHHTQWRLRFEPPLRGEGPYRSYPTREAALKFKEAFERARDEADQKRISEAIDEYAAFLKAKGNKEAGRNETIRRIGVFLENEIKEERSVRGIGDDEAAQIYRRFMTTPRVRRRLLEADGTPAVDGGGKPVFELVPPSVDYQRNTLAEVRTFFTWCATPPQKLAEANPFATVKGEGMRNAGKPQPRIDDARVFHERALEKLEHQRSGWEGALAALLLLYGGPRASELTTRVVDDVDDGGALIRVVRGKTRKARRALPVPAFLRPYLNRLIEGRARSEPLFVARTNGFHDRSWPTDQVQAICGELGIPPITAHGLRGFNGSMLAEQGVAIELIQRHLGHEHASTTMRNYVAAESVEKAKQQRVLHVLSGGRR